MPNTTRKRNGVDVLISKRDVQILVHDVGRDFGLLVRFEIRFVNNVLQVYCKALEPTLGVHAVPQYQALVEAPVTTYKPIENLMYTVVWDVYNQADREKLAKENADSPPQ